jgi:hypothetical protein
MITTEEAMASSYLEAHQRRLILFYSFLSTAKKTFPHKLIQLFYFSSYSIVFRRFLLGELEGKRQF